MKKVLATVLLVFAAAALAWAEEAIPPDGVSWDPPTLHCIGVRWFVREAEHPGATVGVDYRKKTEAAWHKAMPLRRVETAALQERKPAEGTSLYAGSIFDLTPDTDYEVRLALTDKNGGTAERAAPLRTWKEPAAPAPKRTLHVVPGDGGGTGTQADPFKGIKSAGAAAQPGDLFLLHAGVYKGPVEFTKSGTADAPIVWRAAGDGEPAIEGPAGESRAGSCNQKHVFLEGLTFRKARWGLVLHDASYVAVRGCKFLEIGTGITADRYQERLFIADCVFVGPRPWPPDKGGEEHRGVELSGVGHVVAYNRISGFRDGVDTRNDFPVRGIDIHNNDISESQDDGIELDFSESNCRAYRNRITNVNLGISFQPSRGGPNYAVHNVLLNVLHESFKLHLTPVAEGHMTSGGVILHNTVVKNGPPFRVWSNEGPARYFYARNNLYVTREAPYVFEITCPMDFPDFDYDLFAGGPYRNFANWNKARYATIDDFRKGTAQETHSIVVNTTEGVFAAGTLPPADKDEKAPVAKNDMRLAEGSPAIDKGEVLPNINDGFQGAAPDIGACEFGEAPPHYGPRRP